LSARSGVARPRNASSCRASSYVPALRVVTVPASAAFRQGPGTTRRHRVKAIADVGRHPLPSTPPVLSRSSRRVASRHGSAKRHRRRRESVFLRTAARVARPSHRPYNTVRLRTFPHDAVASYVPARALRVVTMPAMPPFPARPAGEFEHHAGPSPAPVLERHRGAAQLNVTANGANPFLRAAAPVLSPSPMSQS